MKSTLLRGALGIVLFALAVLQIIEGVRVLFLKKKA